jgi:hypothetical protein
MNEQNIMQNKKHEQRTDMKMKQKCLGKEPKGVTYIGQVIKELMESR